MEWQLDKREAHSFPLWCVAEAHMRRCRGPVGPLCTQEHHHTRRQKKYSLWPYSFCSSRATAASPLPTFAAKGTLSISVPEVASLPDKANKIYKVTWKTPLKKQKMNNPEVEEEADFDLLLKRLCDYFNYYYYCVYQVRLSSCNPPFPTTRAQIVITPNKLWPQQTNNHKKKMGEQKTYNTKRKSLYSVLDDAEKESPL